MNNGLRHLVAAPRTAGYRNQFGLTLVELMISVALGLVLVNAMLSILLSAKNSYYVQDELIRMQETARYATHIITRSVKQTAYQNWEAQSGPIKYTAELSTAIFGLDAKSLGARTNGIDGLVSKAVNGSDVLAIRFIGSGEGLSGDGTMLNCAGFGVGSPSNLENDRGWSIFYVAYDASGEPELRCKYRGKGGWNSDAIATGVESFQVLYGLDIDGDGIPNRFVAAKEVNQLDLTLSITGLDAQARQLDLNKKTHWKKIVSVKIAILMRSAPGTRKGKQEKQYDLFGKSYADHNAAIDSGTRIKEKELSANSQNRMRKVFTTTIYLRNLRHVDLVHES